MKRNFISYGFNMKIITISGASGSGKSSLAKLLQKALRESLLLSIDRYYLSKLEQLKLNGFCNFDYPHSLDVDLMHEHLSLLKSKGQAKVPVYDFTISERAGYENVFAKDHIIVDGLFAGDILSELSDLNIFMDVDLDLALIRRIERDMKERGRTLESVTNQYINEVRPAYFKHIAHIKNKADLVFSNNDDPDMLKEHAEDVLKILKTK